MRHRGLVISGGLKGSVDGGKAEGSFGRRGLCLPDSSFVTEDALVMSACSGDGDWAWHGSGRGCRRAAAQILYCYASDELKNLQTFGSPSGVTRSEAKCY